METAQFILSYWDLRGTTQALRNLLEYLEVRYEDRIVEWPDNMKYDLKSMIEFPKMPNLKHDGFQCTEIVPIGKYLCRINNRQELLGTTLKDQVNIQTFIHKIFQARRTYLEVMESAQQKLDTDFDKIISQRLKVLKSGFLYQLSQRLSTNQWYMGYLSLADFFLYNLLFYFQGFVPSLIDEVVDKYMTRFQQLQPIQRYFKSGKARHPVSLSEEVNQKWIGKRSYK